MTDFGEKNAPILPGTDEQAGDISAIYSFSLPQFDGPDSSYSYAPDAVNQSDSSVQPAPITSQPRSEQPDINTAPALYTEPAPQPVPLQSTEPAPLPVPLQSSEPAAPLHRAEPDANGAIIEFGNNGIYPDKVRYKDGTSVEFGYDHNDNLHSLRDRDGTCWLRRTMPDHANFAKWSTESNDQSADMSLVVLPNGTWQCINSYGNIQTCTTDGKILLWKPFPDSFDLKRTLFIMFRTIDKNQDSTLSKTEVSEAARCDWKDRSAVQFTALLKEHYDSILTKRHNAMYRDDTGITIEDILKYDEDIDRQQRTLTDPPQHVLDLVRNVFCQLDKERNGAITAHQVRRCYNERSSRTKSERAVIEIMHAALSAAYAGETPSFDSDCNNVTFDDLCRHFKIEYRNRIGLRLKTGGWAIEELWEDKLASNRFVFADAEDLVSSVQLNALRQNVPVSQQFIATFAAVVIQCPHIVARMIRDNGNGRLTVTFPGDPSHPVEVPVPLATDLANFPNHAQLGTWPAIILRAFEKYSKENSLSDRLPLSEFEATELKLAPLDLMTGSQGHWHNLRSVSVHDMHIMLRDVLKQRRAVVCASWGGAQKPQRSPLYPRQEKEPRCKFGKLYTVAGYNPHQSVVSLFDPDENIRTHSGHGFSGSASAVYEMTTSVKLADFVDCFDAIYVEDWEEEPLKLHARKS